MIKAYLLRKKYEWHFDKLERLRYMPAAGNSPTLQKLIDFHETRLVQLVKNNKVRVTPKEGN
jgi:hypothetical protein